MLKRLLGVLSRLQVDSEFTFDIVVADNDADETARTTVSDFAASSSIRTTYCCEPRQNIALARNCAVSSATGDFIAFIDDDEFPCETWLKEMLRVCEEYDSAGVLGPVRPHFETPPPKWITAGGFCERPEHPTGRIMDWEECRTGNLLFRRSLLRQGRELFDPAFGNGGEDKEFFLRQTGDGRVFRWCSAGVVYETVPPARWQKRYMLRRALLRGRNILKHPGGRIRMLATSVIAVPVYTVMLLPMLMGGTHWFMRYLIKLCDHLGRLLAVTGLNPVSQR